MNHVGLVSVLSGIDLNCFGLVKGGRVLFFPFAVTKVAQKGTNKQDTRDTLVVVVNGEQLACMKDNAVPMDT